MAKIDVLNLKKVDLTADNLCETLFESDNTMYIRGVKESIKRDASDISSTYDREEAFIIYCFYMLHAMDFVQRYNFALAYNKIKRIDKKRMEREFLNIN